ncbi:cysteine desulfurase family protein [Leucobacter luti]|uniref:Cysteine desulfurase n=1 Tax=Leucobacter luti TaxID=340320 RepID=A0A4Q7TWH6_9MICO|nr:cysteine desulfurase family protein [Leucobacter luti]MBL3698240.1 cysteine desulfurase [Leucobacter luti]RZT64677.1 cysteine desulfurase [Leucobacter luti]
MPQTRAYLDHAATSPMPEPVLAAYVDALRTVGNPASTHAHGQAASEALEQARDEIAGLLGCDHAELIFTSGGTESVNLALKGMYWARRRAGLGSTILVAEGEHHATIEAAEWLRDTQGATLVWLPIDGAGRLAPETLSSAIAAAGAAEVALASFIWVNNEVGTVQPVAQLCEIASAAGIPSHVDAVAALGQVPVDFTRSGAAAVSVSAHKIGGPVGVGALLLGRRAVADPLVHGGTQQRARSGTQDVAGAVGFAAALRLALAPTGAPGNTALARVTALRNSLIAGVRAADPGAVLRGPAPGAERAPGNAHFTFPGCQGDSLVFLLDAAGVSASVGSACQAGVAEPSHVLRAMGVPEAEAAGALRFTLGAHTTADEVDRLLAALPDALRRARSAGLA